MPSSSVPIVVTHEGGVRFAAQVRSHRIVVDQRAGREATDAGPTPIELLGAALGTCVAYYVNEFCHSRGVAPDGLCVEVEQHGVSNPPRIGRFAVRVTLPGGFPEHLRGLIERVVRSCPAHNTLTQAADVEVVIAEPLLV